jgi:hypothetical protein
MNWRRLCGVTRCDSIENSPEGYGQSTFVGGLTGDDFAVLGLQYLLAPPAQKTLRANKSAFVTRDALILLGSAIQCDAPDDVTTTLFHAPLFEGATYLRNGEPLNTADATLQIAAGETLYLRDVLVRLLAPAELRFEERSGSYALMNRESNEYGEMANDYAQIYSRRWCYLIVEHGVAPEDGSYGAVLWPGVAPDFSPQEKLKITHATAHHGVALDGGARGGEVRFPGDWRIPLGLSYPAAEPAQWGNLAQWQPAENADRLRLQLLPPLRYDRFPNRATEILLPAGMQAENTPSITLGGAPWPRHILPIMADGKTTVMEVARPL